MHVLNFVLSLLRGSWKTYVNKSRYKHMYICVYINIYRGEFAGGWDFMIGNCPTLPLICIPSPSICIKHNNFI